MKSKYNHINEIYKKNNDWFEISNINNFQKQFKIYHLLLGTGITTFNYIRSIQAIDQNGEILILVSGNAESNKNLNIFKFSDFSPTKTICTYIK